MHMQRDLHPTILSSLEGIVDQVNLLNVLLTVAQLLQTHLICMGGIFQERIYFELIVDGLVPRKLVRRGSPSITTRIGKVLCCSVREQGCR